MDIRGFPGRVTLDKPTGTKTAQRLAPLMGDEEEEYRNHSADALSAFHGRDGAEEIPVATPETETAPMWRRRRNCRQPASVPV